MGAKSETRQSKTWVRTRIQGIMKHRSGILYARVYKGGREKWHSLKTPILEVAIPRFRKKVGELEAEAKAKKSANAGRLTVADAIRLFEDEVKKGWSLRGRGSRTRRRVAPRSVEYRLNTITALKKTWPGLTWLDTRQMTPEGRAEALLRRDAELAKIPIRSVSEATCEDWGSRYSKAVSASVFNNTLDTLRYVFEEAVRVQGLVENPAAKVGRCSVKSKTVKLPSLAQFNACVEEINSAGAWCSKDCADFVQFLAFTGARKNEAANVEWRDIDFGAGEVVLRVTKNGELRRVPMISASRTLLERMRGQRAGESLDRRVLRVAEAQGAINGAARKVGMDRITHHDLRHFFATVCIESGVDIPTVSRWLGHKDGGALAMKTYGHLRNEHSKAAAQKVSFNPLGLAYENIFEFSIGGSK
jgi:integrase